MPRKKTDKKQTAQTPKAKYPILASHSLIICFAIIVISIAAFQPVLNSDFILLDDNEYIINNPNIQEGPFLNQIVWAFTKSHSSNWHPITWMSHMIDYKLFGLDPIGHHLTNLLFHIVNSLILFFVLFKITGYAWRSGFAASLFAVHPLHVESVAWVSERKDVLSAFFCFLTIYAYFLFTKNPKIKSFIPVIILFALGLMSKPMLVTLPLILIFLDYWPLGRSNIPFRKLLSEKIPLFALAAASSIVTFIVQREAGAVKTIPLELRLENAAISYIAYLAKMVWPIRLSVLYPFPTEAIPVWKTLGALVLLVSLTILAVRSRKKYPFIFTGWFWYAVTLLPVIGVIQVGGQAMADRYTYIPLVGPFISITWIAAEYAFSRKRLRILLIVFSSVVIIALTLGARLQSSYWQDSEKLFKRSIAVTGNNFVLQDNLGTVLSKKGDFDTAILHFRESIRIEPDNDKAYNNIGSALIKKGLPDKSIQYLQTALKINPENVEAHFNLAVAYYQIGEYGEAWDKINYLRKTGFTPPQKFIEILSSKMPDPGS